MHWERYLVLDPGEDQDDLAAALDLFAPVYQALPDAVPDQIRTFFNEDRPSTSDPAQAGADGAVDLLEKTLRTGGPAALNTAIDLLHQVVDATPGYHPGRAMMLFDLDLALALQARFERSGQLADLDAAVTAGQEAVEVVGVSPRMRVRAAVGWGRAAAGGERWEEAVAGFTRAAELVGQLAPRSLDRDDQEHLLAELGNLGADAAVCCIHTGLAERGVELFEAGRGVLLGQALDTRTDLTALAGQHPTLAEAFTRLRDELDQADPSIGPGSTLTAGDSNESGRRQAAGVAFEAVIDQIRGQAGFERFLRPPLISELHAAADNGSVVIDRIISATTPTLHALTHTRPTHPEDQVSLTGGGRLVAIAMPPTPPTCPAPKPQPPTYSSVSPTRSTCSPARRPPARRSWPRSPRAGGRASPATAPPTRPIPPRAGSSTTATPSPSPTTSTPPCPPATAPPTPSTTPSWTSVTTGPASPRCGPHTCTPAPDPCQGEPLMTNTDTDQGIRIAAQVIRPYLTDWFTAGDAADLDRRIAGILTTPAEPAARAHQLRALLDAHPHTRRFLHDVLADAPHYRPPDQQPDNQPGRPGVGLAGDPGPAGADRYTCPHGDYTWYRPDVAAPIPDCPTHQVALARS
ncbi:hypothetical protein FraQA3DRAFT_2296 [Frankia sp. QA3]|nr:hypothetical protein FraQA3DRAFT_2296 [Frankia sp. QA3]